MWFCNENEIETTVIYAVAVFNIYTRLKFI